MDCIFLLLGDVGILYESRSISNNLNQLNSMILSTFMPGLFCAHKHRGIWSFSEGEEEPLMPFYWNNPEGLFISINTNAAPSRCGVRC